MPDLKRGAVQPEITHASGEQVSSKEALTEVKIRRMPKKDYMNEKQLAFFKQRLLELETQTEAHIEQMRVDLGKEEREIDENVQASLEENRALILRIINRESKLLPKIHYSLQKIAEGSYGYCEDTGEPIGIERLLLRPTARLSVTAKNYQEEKEREYSDD